MCNWTDCAWNSALGESSTSNSVAGPCPASLTAPPHFSEFVSDDKLSTLSRRLILKNTYKNTKWAPEYFRRCLQQAISRRPRTRWNVYKQWPWCFECPSFFVTASFELRCIHIRTGHYYSIMANNHMIFEPWTSTYIVSCITLWTACASTRSMPQGGTINIPWLPWGREIWLVHYFPFYGIGVY